MNLRMKVSQSVWPTEKMIPGRFLEGSQKSALLNLAWLPGRCCHKGNGDGDVHDSALTQPCA